MTRTYPVVSVIIPTYKREPKYLFRAIDSILKQTYKNVEIVVINDNPPETNYRKNIKNSMLKYKDYSNIIYHENYKNMGGALTRNKGIALANGEFITFLDDDDEYLPEKIDKQVVFMTFYNYDMSFTDLKLVNKNKDLVDYRSFNDLKTFDKKTLLKYHISKHLTGTPTFMYKTSSLKDLGGFEDAIMGQEFFLMLKTIENNLEIGYLKRSDVLAYRHDDGGISHGKNKIIGEKILYKVKTEYFHLFTLREKMFIKFRHHAVMAVAFKRNKRYVKSFIRCIIMVCSSPIDSIKESIKFLKKKNNYKKWRYKNVII